MNIYFDTFVIIDCPINCHFRNNWPYKHRYSRTFIAATSNSYCEKIVILHYNS